MRRLCLLILSICMLILSGCATINSDITINTDGSGSWDAQLISQAGPLEKKVITDTLAKYNVQNYSLFVPDQEGKMEKVADNDIGSRPVWKIVTKFNTPAELEQIRNAFTTQLKGETSDPALQETADGNFIVNLGTSPGTTKVKVSGEILPETVKDGNVQGDIITFTENENMQFTFKPGHSWLFYIAIILGITIVGGIGYMFYLRRKYYGDAQ